MDIIANWVTPSYYNQGRAISFYNHLVSLSQNYNACLLFDNLYKKFAYQAETSVLFSGRVLAHSVPKWSEGERIIIAYYTKNNV